MPKYGRTAVRRNRVKRRLREALRVELLPRLDTVEPAQDVLVRARREAYGVPYATLARELIEWMDRTWPGSS